MGWATVAIVAVLAVGATRLDVADSVIDRLGRLPSVVANAAVVAFVAVPLAVALFQWFRARRAADAEDELGRLSLHDALTDLPNRLALQRQLPTRIRAANRANQKVAVLFCDLDRFKQVNDTYGHDTGDRLMQAVAHRLLEAVAPSGALESVATPYRYGGDEFVVVSHGVASAGDAERLGRRLVSCFDAPFEVGQDTIRIGMSVGISLAVNRGDLPENLLRDADTAMYHAKRQDSQAVQLFDATMTSGLSRSTAKVRLHKAIEDGEFGLLFEPVLSVGDGRLVAVRAQLRWSEADAGTVAPGEFMPALEETGLILPLGSWMLAESCRHARRWRMLRPDAPLQVVSPVTARQLAQANFRDVVATSLNRTGAERSQVCLAVQDSSLSDEITDAWGMLRYVRTLGVAVALDGFGSSTSAFANLRRARLDQLWLDPTLSAGLEAEADDAVIVRHLVALAHELDIRVVATGVDSAAQLAILRQMGGDRAVGPFLGRPLTPEDVDIVLTRRPAPVPEASTRAPTVEDPDLAWATTAPRPVRSTEPLAPEGRPARPPTHESPVEEPAEAVVSAPELPPFRPYRG